MAPISPPSSRARLWQVEAHVVIVHDVALGADRGVGRDEPTSSRELSSPARHLPDDGAALKAIDRARPQHALAQRRERQLAGLAIAEAATLDKSPVSRDLHLRLEGGARTGLRFRFYLYPLGRHRGTQDLPARAGLGGELPILPLHGTGP